MLQSIGTVAMGILILFGSTPVLAQSASSPGPPMWQDGASAYLTTNGPATHGGAPQRAVPGAEYGTAPQGIPAEVPVAPSAVVDRDVLPVSHNEAIPSGTTQADRYLAPPTEAALSAMEQLPGGIALSRRDERPVATFGVSANSLYTVGCALAIVIGVFLACAWLLRRGTSSTAAALPADVVSVLGRVPLAARQFAQLLRVGNKLVLVSISPGGAETITEVTDSAEVDRLAGLCQQSNPHSTTKAFEQVFQQLAHERTPNGFFGNDPLPPTLSPPPEVGLFRTPRGEAARA